MTESESFVIESYQRLGMAGVLQYLRMLKTERSAFLIVFSGFILTLLFIVPGKNIAHADCDETDTACINDQIDKLEKKLKDASKKKDVLVQNLNQINTSLTSTQQMIQKTLILLNEAAQTIDQKEQEIANLEQQLTLEKEVLKGLIQELYYADEVWMPEVMFSEDEVKNFFQGNDSLLSTQEKMQEVIGDINDMKSKVAGEKLALEDVKKDQEALLVLKNRQKQSLVADKLDTQGNIEDQQTVIDRLNKELSQLQNDLNTILGKSYNAKDIKDAVDFASKVTGVPKGFLFGVLKMETNLGANVGGCTYAQVEDGAMANYKKGKLGKVAWATFQRRRDLFKAITKELDIDYRKQKVSCNPRGYTGTGGAMGVAQFMPDTWNAYKSAVTSATGHNPPSPWNLTDGVTAMALKLDKVPGVDDGNRSAWKKAAAAYLGTSYPPYINGILYWADHYKELL